MTLIQASGIQDSMNRTHHVLTFTSCYMSRLRGGGSINNPGSARSPFHQSLCSVCFNAEMGKHDEQEATTKRPNTKSPPGSMSCFDLVHLCRVQRLRVASLPGHQFVRKRRCGLSPIAHEKQEHLRRFHILHQQSILAERNRPPIVRLSSRVQPRLCQRCIYP
jgi:hypothetical protein